MAPVGRSPMRVVLRWQIIITVTFSIAAYAVIGSNAALSALLGGSISVVATLVFMAVARLGKANSAGLALLAVLRAEAVKVFVIIALLWLVMKAYAQLVPTIFIATFIVAVLIQSMAFFVRDK
ncbi:MAG: ATP synthase subunit I [Betaproteobacteria bacterium]|nr:ATP synthase subunit I [Betaproteobacteria bacterium]